MGNWFRQPMLSLLLLLSWLLLVDSFTTPGHWLLGIALALIIPRLIQTWWLPAPAVQSWTALGLFFWRVLVDIIKGNIEVARMALGPQERLEPKFIEFETTLDNDLAIYMLMSAISLAPGSALTGYDEPCKRIGVHALHCTDTGQLEAGIRERYENILHRVFAC